MAAAAEPLDALDLVNLPNVIDCFRGRKSNQATLGRDEAGSLLWDYSATETYASSLVEHGTLRAAHELLELSLPPVDSSNARLAELALGICANLCSFRRTAADVAAVDGIVDLVVHVALLSYQVPVLTEACRLLDAALSSQTPEPWVQALQAAKAGPHVLFIAANTLDPQLQLRSTELLTALLRSGAAPAEHLMAGGLVTACADVIAAAAESFVGEEGRQAGAKGGWEDDSEDGAAAACEPPPTADALTATLRLLECVGDAAGGAELLHGDDRLLPALLRLLQCCATSIEAASAGAWPTQLLLTLTSLGAPVTAALVRQPLLLAGVVQVLQSAEPDDQDALAASWYLLASSARGLAAQAAAAAAVAGDGKWHGTAGDKSACSHGAGYEGHGGGGGGGGSGGGATGSELPQDPAGCAAPKNTQPSSLGQAAGSARHDGSSSDPQQQGAAALASKAGSPGVTVSRDGDAQNGTMGQALASCKGLVGGCSRAGIDQSGGSKVDSITASGAIGTKHADQGGSRVDAGTASGAVGTEHGHRVGGCEREGPAGEASGAAYALGWQERARVALGLVPDVLACCVDANNQRYRRAYCTAMAAVAEEVLARGSAWRGLVEGEAGLGERQTVGGLAGVETSGRAGDGGVGGGDGGGGGATQARAGCGVQDSTASAGEVEGMGRAGLGGAGGDQDWRALLQLRDVLLGACDAMVEAVGTLHQARGQAR